MISKGLDKLYRWSGYLAALFLMLIAVAVIVQVVGRIFEWALDFTRLSGFFMAAATFLALPNTFKRGGHVRVELLMGRLSGAKRIVGECAVCVVGAVIIGYLGYHVILMTIMSYELNDVTTGVLALPFWLPQLAMTIGLVLLEIALFEEFFLVASGRHPSYDINQDAVLEDAITE